MRPFLILSALLPVAGSALAHGRGELLPLALTGAPGEGSCTQCHNSAANTKPGKVELLFQALQRYSPGVKQRVTLRITSGGLPNNGFQLSARFADNTQAGSFSGWEANAIVQRPANGIQYLAHYTSGIGNVATFVFDWTPADPPTNAGEVRFYVQAVSGNGDGMASNLDSVFTATVSLFPEMLPEPAGFRVSSRFQAFQSSTTAYGISNDGRIAGAYVGPSLPFRPLLRTVDGAISTFDVPGSYSAWAYGVNSSGDVVGAYDSTASTRKRAFRRAASGEVTAFDVPGALETVLTGINDAGRMTGYFLDSSGELQGILVEPNGSFQITEAPVNRLLGISAAGNTIGLTGPGSSAYMAASPSGRALLFPACGADEIAGINDRGEVVTPCRYAHPSGRTINLTNLFGSFFFGVNNAGVIVGSNEGQGAIHEACPAAPLAATSATVPANGASGRISVLGIADCWYVFESDASWVQIDRSGNYTVSANPSGLPRTASIRAAGQIFTLTQSATACSYTFSGGVPTVGWPGGSYTLNVLANEGCTWTPSANVPWIRFASTATNSGNGTISYTIQPNPNTVVRTGTITVADQQFVINQAGGPGCTYTLSSSAFNFMIEGGNGTVTVTTQPGCPWTASTAASWISFLQGSSGTGTGPLVFRVDANTGPLRSASIALAGLTVVVQQQGAVAGAPLRFVPVTPCRAVDTRVEGGKGGGFGPPRMAGQSSREFALPQSGCGLPATARAYSVNITVVPPGYLGYLTVWPSGSAQPFVSTLNSWNGRVVANAAIVPAGANGSISVFVSDESDVIIDVNGYFVPATQSETLAFYPVTPCRVSDTRASGGKTGSYGPPAIAGQTSRTYNVPGSGCGVPSTARAFSLNVTAVPPGYLGFITLWPGGQSQPFVSTLNSWDGTVVPNAAIVPAGANGDVSVYASNDTDVVMDINGYFAPPGLPGALNFYTVNPCRVADTRAESGKTGAFGAPSIAGNSTRTIPMPDAGCNLPSTARAYSINITAAPPGYLGYITTWPAGLPIPLASTLNSWNGQVVANAALVPAGTSGAINVFASNPTDLIIDVNGYFAP